MLKIEFTEKELLMIREALEDAYYIAKDNGEKSKMQKITRLETKISENSVIE